MAFFSGGKDGLYALHLAQERGLDVPYLLLMKTSLGRSPHYVNIESLEKVAISMKKELLVFDMAHGSEELAKFISSLGISHIVGGDVFLDVHYKWLEHLSKESGAIAVEPLYGKKSLALTEEILQSGFEYSIIATDRSKLSKDFLGYSFKTTEDVRQFASKNPGVDLVGEGGEFHTIVLTSPLFEESFCMKHMEIEEAERYDYLKFSIETVKASV